MRIFDAVYVFFICSNFSNNHIALWLPIILISESICRVYSTASFVNFGAFFNRIADERVGGLFLFFFFILIFKKIGSYITALNSCHNLGN